MTVLSCSNLSSLQTPDLSLLSPAKLNLFLHITGKRLNGYHNLQTVFRLLDWGDQLDFYKTNAVFNPNHIFDGSNSPIRLISNITLTSDPFDNLVMKAAVALLKALQTSDSHTLPDTLPIITVVVNKKLPMGAGLGGGSSNAAITLQALNTLWSLNISKQNLIKISATIGADVPIFLFGKDAIATGIGDTLTAIDLSSSSVQHYLVLSPSMNDSGAHANTAKLFGSSDLQRDCSELTVAQIEHNQQDYVANLNPPFQNVFEPVVTQLVPQTKKALSYLTDLESITQTKARMTGSGSSVFLPLHSLEIDTLKQQIKAHIQTYPAPCHAIVVKAILR